jgi:hypothetical protein
MDNQLHHRTIPNEVRCSLHQTIDDHSHRSRELVAPSMDGQEVTLDDDSVFAWEKHIDRRTGDGYFFNPRTAVSQWDPPTTKVKRTGK